TTGPTPTAASSPSPPQVARVEVLARNPDGRLLVRVDGRELAARSDEPMEPGGRYVVQVERSTAGVTLRALQDRPELPVEVASAVRRDTPHPPELGASLKPLLAELNALPDAATGPQPEAAATVRQVLSKLLPAPGHAPDAAQLKAVVED